MILTDRMKSKIPPSPEKIVETMYGAFPDRPKKPPPHPDRRPVHTYGTCVRGTFTATQLGSQYCTAEHFSGEPIPVVVRFSNGNGDAPEDDAKPDVHGMAVKFHVGDGVETDLIAMTLASFFVRDATEFVDFTEKGYQPNRKVRFPGFLTRLKNDLWLKPSLFDPACKKDYEWSGTPGLIKWANKRENSYARAALASFNELYRPTSWVRAEYHAVHTFELTGADSVARYAKFKWEPIAGIHPIPPLPKDADPCERIFPLDGLRADLRERLAHWPARMQLKMALAEAGDPLADVTKTWPLWRHTVVAGELEIHDDWSEECEDLSFNPARLIPGISGVDGDTIFEVRRGAYEWSCHNRGGTGCPVAHGEGSPT